MTLHLEEWMPHCPSEQPPDPTWVQSYHQQWLCPTKTISSGAIYKGGFVPITCQVWCHLKIPSLRFQLLLIQPEIAAFYLDQNLKLWTEDGIFKVITARARLMQNVWKFPLNLLMSSQIPKHVRKQFLGKIKKQLLVPLPSHALILCHGLWVAQILPLTGAL